jgi:hypothetical protein
MINLTKLPVSLFLLVLALSFVSAVIVDADYASVNPGKEARITINVDNNEDFDIENVRVSLLLNETPFSSVGSSTKDVDDLSEGDDDSTSFTLRASTDAVPGDYDIPYTIKYLNADNSSLDFSDSGSFGIRIGAETDLDFTAETRDAAIVGQEGQISLEIINRGLGDIKSISVELEPRGFELISAKKIFIGTIESDDSDLANFDVIYRNQNPSLVATVNYKDFDNNDQVETISIPLKAYTQEQALDLGLVKKSNTMTYILIIVFLIILWFTWRTVKKRKKKKQQQGDSR